MGTQDGQATETPDVDNSISGGNETPNKDNSQKVEIDYKQRYSDSTKEAQKLVADKKALEDEKLINNAFRQVLKDNSALLDIDEEIGREVVKAMHEDGYATTDSYEEILESLSGDKKTPKPVDEKKLTEKIREQIKSEEQSEKSQKVIDDILSKYDEETKAKYLAEFKEILGGRNLTPELAKREIEKIIVYYSKDSGDEALSKFASNPIKSGKTSTKSKPTIQSLKDMGVPEKEIKTLYPDLYPKK